MNHDSNNPNTAGIKIGLPNSSNKGFDIKAGIIESNPNTPYNPNNNLKLYDSKNNAKIVAIACIVDCPFDMISKEQQNKNDMLNFGKQTADSTKQLESTNLNNTPQPLNYKDSNITAKEMINNDNTSTLVIESKTNLLEYQGNTADTLMSGLSGVFASIATLAEKYGLDEAVKKAGGAKGRVLASVLFQTQGASISLAYNYGTNGRDMAKAGVSVGIEILAGSVATAFIPATAPVLVFVGVAALASVGISLLLNTQASKDLIDTTIDFLQSKLQSFFSLFKSNPNAYELISNPNLESKDYQSLIELLLDTNSTAKDIDSLLHSFPHYLQDSKQPLESTNPNSTPTQSSTESNSTQSTTPTTKSPQQTKESNTPKNNNPNTKNTNTFPFQLAIKDYNTFTPLSNKQIQITNIDSKQIYTQTTDSRGLVSFRIDSKQRGDFFNVKLINDDDYEQTPYFLAKQTPTNPQRQQTITHTAQKILTPNNYQNHPALLYFKPKLSLYFNGTILCIMQGRQNLASFSARSGKALNIKEKEVLQQKSGYKYFVTHTHKGLFSNETMYFCLDTEWQKQKDKGAIPEGEYYIKPSEINKRTTYIQENTFGINTRIYTDKECTNVVESNTNRDNFYLHGGDKYGNAGGIDVASSDNDFFGILQDKLDPAQEVVKLQVTYPKNLESHIDFISMSDDGLQRDKEYLHTKTIFAPGTYIELEAKLSDNVESGIPLQWAFTLLYNQKDVDSLFTHNTFHTYTFYPLLDSTQIAQQEHNVRTFTNDTNTGIDTTKLGFSLPLIREYEDSTQCFVLIFAFESTKTKPDRTDPYTIIDMSFKVGEDSVNGVIESKREEQSDEQKAIYNQTSINNLQAWNKLQCICSVKEAVEFLRANINHIGGDIDNVRKNFFKHCKKYPSLAGKIAYIYYRFDVGDEGFVDGVEKTCYVLFNCKDEYVEERDMDYIKSIVTLFDKKQSYLQNKTFLQKYKEIFHTNNPNNVEAETKKVEQRKHFIEYLVFKIIETLGLSYPANFTLKKDTKNPYKGIVIFFKEGPKLERNGKLSLRSGYVKNQTIHFNTLAIEKGNFTFTDRDIYYPFRHNITFEYILNTIFHEIRHFYIKEKYKENDSSAIKRYIHCSNYFYINTSIHTTIFDKFYKNCIYDDANNVGCILNNNQNAYQIQPNERDPRYVAHQIMKKLKEKGL